MLAEEELALLYTLARDYASGEGAIVDAGCFLGGSSAALLAGLRDRPRPWAGPPLASYDLFRVEPYTVDEFFGEERAMEVGSSFRSLYDRNVAGFDVPHTVLEGDIVAHGWSGQPIEVLFLDVLKTAAVNDAVLRDFFPHVIPGKTLVVHQDYEWGYQPWLHITVELMRDSLRRIDSVPHCTHLFLVERPIPEELLGMSVWRDIDDERKVRLIDQAIDGNVGPARGMVELSKAVLLFTLGRSSDAATLLTSVEQRYDSPSVAGCAADLRSELRMHEPDRPQPAAPRSASLDWDVPELDLDSSAPAREEDAAAVSELVREYGDAIVASDARRACAALSSELLTRMARTGSARTATFDACVELLTELLAGLTPTQRAAAAALDVVDVRMQEGYAFAVCSVAGQVRGTLPAHRDRDAWKLAAVQARPLNATI
jgi:hypothetical protein